MKLYVIANELPNGGKWSGDPIEACQKPIYSFEVGKNVYPIQFDEASPQLPNKSYIVNEWKAGAALTPEELVPFRIFLGGSHAISFGPCYALRGARVELTGQARCIFGTQGSILTLRDRASGDVSGLTVVELFDQSYIRLDGNAAAKAHNDARLRMFGNSTAECWDRCIVSMRDYTSVTCHHATVKVAATNSAKIIGDYTVNPLYACTGNETC